MLGRQVLGGVDGDDLAQLAGVDARDHLADDRHGAHHQADEQRRRIGPGKPRGEGEAFGFGADDRLLGEDRGPDGQGEHQVLEMQVVRRAQHQQVVGARREQLGGRGVGAAHRDAEALQDRLADRRRIAVARELKVPTHLDHGAQHMGDPLAQADDADAIDLHPASQARAVAIRQHCVTLLTDVCIPSINSELTTNINIQLCINEMQSSA